MKTRSTKCSTDSSLQNGKHQSEVQSKIAFSDKVEKLIVEAAKIFEGDTGAVHRSAQVVGTALKNLRNAVNRQRAEEVVNLVQNDQLEQAAKRLTENYPALQLNDLEEIVRQCSCGDEDDLLVNVINFVEFVDEGFQVSAYATIYEEMCSMDRSTDVEILLLQSKVEKFKEEEVKEIKLKIASDVDKLIDKFVEEARRVEIAGVLCEKAYNLSSEDVLSDLIPKIVAKYFEDPANDLTLLVNYSDKFSTYSHSYYLIDAVYKQLEQRHMLESSAALHLWAHVQQTLENDPLYPADIDSRPDQIQAVNAYNGLKQHEKSYYDKLMRMIDSNELHDFVGYTKMSKVLGGMVSQYYSEDINNAKQLISNCRTGKFIVLGVIMKSLYQEMEKCGHLASFQAFHLFQHVHFLTKDGNYKNQSDVEFVRQKVPKCLKELLWNDNRKCRIVNKYYREPLHVSPDKNNVCSWVPSAYAANQLWKVYINTETSLVVIYHCNRRAKIQVCTSHAKVGTICIMERGTRWMIKAFDEDHIKIFHMKDGNEEYLTANPSLCETDKNSRRIQLTRENATDRQLWQLEFVP